MNLSIFGEQHESQHYSIEQLAAAAPHKFLLSERVPGVGGEAFDLKSWYFAVVDNDSNQPTHLRIEGSDEFQAIIPWNQLDQAAILYKEEGQPLRSDFPLRLYVPDGSSKCLNVKRLAKLYLLSDERLGDKAIFGFKNEVSVNELKKR